MSDGLDLGGPIPNSWPYWDGDHSPRDVGFLAIVRRADGRITRALSLGETPARRTARTARAEGLPSTVVPVRLVALDGEPLDGRVPPVPDVVEAQAATRRTRARRRRRLDGLVPVEEFGEVVDLGAFDRPVLRELDGDEDLDAGGWSA